MISIIEYLQGLGLHTVDSDYRAHIDTWLSWYRGKVEDFHSYTIFNGITNHRMERATLAMAKTVAEDWANLLLNERVQIAASQGQNALDACLEANDFAVIGNRAVEQAFALGTAGFSEYLDGEGRVRIDAHKGSEVWPLAWHGSTITECAFSSQDTRDGKKAVYLRLYRQESGRYVIENHWLDWESGKELPAPEGVAPRVETGLEIPPFQILTPNLANNIDTTCPMGLSVYANAIDALKSVDAAYDSFRNEFLLGRKRLLVPVSMIQVERSRGGGPQPVFDPHDMVYTAYQPAGDQAKDFHDLSPEIRAEEHIVGIRANLNMLSFKCGLGTGRYEFDRAAGVRTATEVISEQSDLYQSMQKHEIVLRAVLIGLARVVLRLCGYGDPEITITFDDSIIQDKNTQRADAREDVDKGLMSKYRYLTEVVGMSDTDAAEELQRIRQESSISAEATDFFALAGSSTP
jgi:A118 family predicted phage portal protein